MNLVHLHALWKEAVVLDWQKFRPRIATRCTIAITLIIVISVAVQRPAYGIIGASGALSVGFGVYQQFTTWRIAPMLLASIGMALSAIIGSVAGQIPDGYILCAALWGMLTGLGSILGTGGWWIVTQWTIALLVAGSYPAPLHPAMMRGLLVLAGGVIQIVITGCLFPIGPDMDTGILPFEQSLAQTFLEGLRTAKNWVFALRSAITLAIACLLYQSFQIPNGYWIPVTAVILLKPEFRETLMRSLTRIGGTVLGACIATLVVALLRPDEQSLLLLVILFAWLSYSFVQVNYALFALTLTAYIVFLIGLAHLSPIQVVAHRLFATAIGGGLALLAHIIPVPFLNERVRD